MYHDMQGGMIESLREGVRDAILNLQFHQRPSPREAQKVGSHLQLLAVLDPLTPPHIVVAPHHRRREHPRILILVFVVLRAS